MVQALKVAAGVVATPGLRKDCMRKVYISLLAALLVFSLAGCLPSFDAEAEEHFYQGIEYRRQGNNDSAMEEFTRAIELDPEYYFAYYNRALVHNQRGELESSLADYNKAIELHPDNAYWTFERGFLYLELGEREKAIIDLERALELGLPPDYRQRVEEALTQLRP
jgi:tetratricopeptide (TPR) repeat protein